MNNLYRNIIKNSVLAIFLMAVKPVDGQTLLQELGASGSNVEPVRQINTGASEISPFFVDGQLYFSAVPQEYSTARRQRNNTAFYSIYRIPINTNALPSGQRTMVSGFGREFHEGPADYCDATGELFVTLSNNSPEVMQNRDEKVRLRIVIMKFINERWQITEEFPFNDKNYHFAHPAISVTGDTLVFSSDLDSLSYGNSDLFMSVRENGRWNEPVNLGGYINTPGDEVFPTFLPGGYLSFATNGRTIKFGGLDIYYVDFPGLDEVRIFGGEINSESDDFGLNIYSGRRVGFFTSNRNEENSDDIYRVIITE